MACPYCTYETKQLSLSSTTTLIGWLSGQPNPNHVTDNMECGMCGAKYTLHSRCSKQWTTDKEGYLLTGVPNCFETFIGGRELSEEAKEWSQAHPSGSARKS